MQPTAPSRPLPKIIKTMVPLFNTKHEKENTGSFSNNNNTIFDGLMEDQLKKFK